MEAAVHNKTSPVEDEKDKDEEPQHHSNTGGQLPVLLSSCGFQPIFTQQQVDAALYGHSTCDITRLSVSHASSVLRPTSLSYGNPHFIMLRPTVGYKVAGH